MHKYIIGIDEVGWGAIAGPIVICAAVAPADFINPGLKDSKRYTTDKAREKGCRLAQKSVLCVRTSFIPVNVIEAGPGVALRSCQTRLVKNILKIYNNSLIIVDGNKPIDGIPLSIQKVLPKADSIEPIVSAASIIAKYTRDCYMKSLEGYDEWEFGKNKGYLTPEHMKKLETLVPIKGVHRFNIDKVRRNKK